MKGCVRLQNIRVVGVRTGRVRVKARGRASNLRRNATEFLKCRMTSTKACEGPCYHEHFVVAVLSEAAAATVIDEADESVTALRCHRASRFALPEDCMLVKVMPRLIGRPCTCCGWQAVQCAL